MLAVAIANLKGGVGKSTTTLFLAEHWALLGMRVLVIDLDPQANCSFMLLSRDGLRQCEDACKTLPHLFADIQSQPMLNLSSYIFPFASDLKELQPDVGPGRISRQPLPAVGRGRI